MLVLREGLSPVCFVILICLCCLFTRLFLGQTERGSPYLDVLTSAWFQILLLGVRGWFPDSDCEAWVRGEVTTGECPRGEGGLGRDRASRGSTAKRHIGEVLMWRQYTRADTHVA